MQQQREDAVKSNNLFAHVWPRFEYEKFWLALKAKVKKKEKKKEANGYTSYFQMEAPLCYHMMKDITGTIIKHVQSLRKYRHIPINIWMMNGYEPMQATAVPASKFNLQ